MKLDVVAKMYNDFVSLSAEGQRAVLEKVKEENPLLYSAFKQIADSQKEGGENGKTE